MCGIATNTKPKKDIENRFSAKIVNDFFLSKPIAKAFANDTLPVITCNNPKEIVFYEWGLIPNWAENDYQVKKIRAQTINARSETVFEKASFKDSIIHQRCLILCDGFIEYQHNGKQKQAFYVQLKSEQLFAMAGIFSAWKNPANPSEIKKTFSIITVPANELMSIVHNSKLRMPLILTPSIEQDWLMESKPEKLKKMFLPYNSAAMKAHTINNNIGKAKSDLFSLQLLDKIETVVQPTLF